MRSFSSKIAACSTLWLFCAWRCVLQRLYRHPALDSGRWFRHPGYARPRIVGVIPQEWNGDPSPGAALTREQVHGDVNTVYRLHIRWLCGDGKLLADTKVKGANQVFALTL